MTNYRRNFVPGGSYFFTVNLADRRLRLLTEHIDLLRAAFRYAQTRHSFEIAAAVILPDHLHAIWTLPEGDADYALRWRLIKSAFSRGLPKDERISASRARKPCPQGGARHLAAPILGAYRAGRRRFCPPCRLHSLQSGETWTCRSRAGLAALDVSSYGTCWRVSAGLGR